MPLKMRKNQSPKPPETCALTECMAVIAGAWAPNVIWHLRAGPRRFSELRADIPPISAKVLSTRLSELEARGVIPLLWGSDEVRAALEECSHILVSTGPKDAGDPVLALYRDTIARRASELEWVGYLSTTGVYGHHDGGWVTAYAHNKELFVKRGDRVTRGRVIAKSGSTGSVSSPQLHFELRKGADAVDPMKYLSSTKVAGG